MQTRLASLLAILTVACVNLPVQGGLPEDLPQVGYHPGGPSPWGAPYFANALNAAKGWLSYTGYVWGTVVTNLFTSPQFNINGYPQWLNPDEKFRSLVAGFSLNYDYRPASWPARNRIVQGKVTLTWQGDADIQLANGSTFITNESNGGSTGSITNGRRTYLYQGVNYLQTMQIHAINSNNPISDIKIWLPDPANPTNSTLEGQLFHPTLIARLADTNWGYIRFMVFMNGSDSPMQDWSDRRPPAHVFMNGVLNKRPPYEFTYGDRETGAAFEHMVALCNQADKDLWINVPHLATDSFITRMAQLIRFGSDGTNAYTNVVASPVYAGLSTNRKVYIEYSNEIWQRWQAAFAQGEWANQQATNQGLTREVFIARQFCRAWRIFQEVFDNTSRLVRVAAVFSASPDYSRQVIQEIGSYGVTQSPPVSADVMALTTYFGNGIQDWVYTNTSILVTNRIYTDSYWTGALFEAHMNLAFDEWNRRLLSGDANQGGGYDTTGVGGGFGPEMRTVATNTLSYPLPIIAYEGGPSLYCDMYDTGSTNTAGITLFIEGMNRHPRFRDIYSINLNMSKSKGLWSHTPFVDCSKWGRGGQWGHLEYMDQAPADSVKYKFLLDWYAEASALRHIDRPAGAVPQFDTSYVLPPLYVNRPYSNNILVSGGDGEKTIRMLGQHLPSGLTANVSASTDLARVSGRPLAGGTYYLYLRVTDGDGDPAWRMFSIASRGGPGTLVESDFQGTAPGLHLPWTNTAVLATNLSYSGWIRGSGIYATNGDDAIVYYVNSETNETESTLARAISSNDYLAFTIQASGSSLLELANAEVRFSIRRLAYHAPRNYAVFTSVGGFVAGIEVFDTGRFGDEVEREFIFRLPDSAAYTGLTGVVEFRIYAYGGTYNNPVNQTSLTGFKVTAVNQAPTANPNYYEADENQALTVTPPGVLSNATDPTGDPLSATLASGPSHGSLTLNADGSLEYVPTTNWCGIDAFTYRASDGEAYSPEATVSVRTVSADINLQLSGVGSHPEDGCVLVWTGALGRLYDIESSTNLLDSLTWNPATGDIAGADTEVCITNPANGDALYYRIRSHRP